MTTTPARNAFSYSLYFAIAFISTLTQWPDPLTWRAWLASLLAGMIAIKAKDSKPGSSEPQEVQVMNSESEPVPTTEAV